MTQADHDGLAAKYPECPTQTCGKCHITKLVHFFNWSTYSQRDTWCDLCQCDRHRADKSSAWYAKVRSRRINVATN